MAISITYCQFLSLSSCVVFLAFIGSKVPPSAAVNITSEAGSDVKEDCQARLESFAESVGVFTFCAIRHARPIQLCEMCVGSYVNVKKTHDDILQLEDWSGNTCRLELINLDRLEIIESTFNNVDDLWSRGKCNNCFAFSAGNLTTDLSNSTREFQRLRDATDACFEAFNATASDAGRLEPNVCTHCRVKYCQMNEFYNVIKADAGDGDICIDIVDTMNSTRLKWSQTYGCSLNVMQLDVGFIVAVCVVLLCPVVFYVAARVYAVQTETRLLRQNRLAGHLSSASPLARQASPFAATPSTSRRSGLVSPLATLDQSQAGLATH